MISRQVVEWPTETIAERATRCIHFLGQWGIVTGDENQKAKEMLAHAIVRWLGEDPSLDSGGRP